MEVPIQLKKATINKDITQMINDILHIFSNETGLAIFFFDSEGSEVLSQHKKSLSPLCSYLKSHGHTAVKTILKEQALRSTVRTANTK